MPEIELSSIFCTITEATEIAGVSSSRIIALIRTGEIRFSSSDLIEHVARECENCGNYFIPISRSDEKYCDRIINGKSCKDIGYYNKLQTDSALVARREYRKAYKTKNAYKNRKIKNRPDIRETFQKWVCEAKRKLHETETGLITLKEFKKWLSKPI